MTLLAILLVIAISYLFIQRQVRIDAKKQEVDSDSENPANRKKDDKET